MATQPRPVVATQQRAALRPQAQVQSHGSGLAAADNSLIGGLMQGLAAVNPALNRYIQQQDNLEQAAYTKGVEEGKTAGASTTDPLNALSNMPIHGSSEPPPAYGLGFVKGMNESLAHRSAVETKTDALVEYRARRNEAGFDATAFIAEKRAEAVKGAVNPEAAAVMAQHFDELAANIKVEQGRIDVQRREEIQQATFATNLGDMVTRDLGPSGIAEAVPAIFQHGAANGMTSPEVAGHLFNRIASLSDTAGGAPELFDAMDAKDPSGIRLGELVPGLRAKIDAARTHAEKVRDQRILEESERSNGMTMAALHTDITANPEQWPLDRIAKLHSKYGAVRSEQAIVSLWDMRNRALASRADTDNVLSAADQGTMWWYPAESQRRGLDAFMMPQLHGLLQSVAAGDQAGIESNVTSLVNSYNQTGATEKIERLARFITTNVTMAPSPDGTPPAGFTASARVFKMMDGRPDARSVHFDRDTTALMSAYNEALDAYGDTGVAYTYAYSVAGTEAQKRAGALKDDPKLKKMVETDALKFVEGNAAWYNPFGTKAKYDDRFRRAFEAEAQDYRQHFGFASEAQTKAHYEQWAASRWALDGTTGVPVPVPQGTDTRVAAEAFTAMSAALIKEHQIKDRTDSDWTIQYLETAKGVYTALAFNGGTPQVLKRNLNINDIVTAQRAKKVLTDSDKAQLAAARDALNAGKPYDLDPAVLAKANALGLFKAEGEKLNDLQRDQAVSAVSRALRLDVFGKPTAAQLAFMPGRTGKVDTALTARTAAYLNADNPAASLVAMAEGMSLRAYDDPATGRNIGAGYSLTANSATVRKDLEAVGVPGALVQDVIDGKASITATQANRLLTLSIPRYEERARDAVGVDTWKAMSREKQAVLVDVAYQVGSVDKFKKAIAALKAGDDVAFLEETKTFYKDRTTGDLKEDKRRNALRASILAGDGRWRATINEYGKVPTTKLDAIK